MWLALCLSCALTSSALLAAPEDYELVYSQDFSDEGSLDDFVFASPVDYRRVRVGERWALEYGNDNRQSSYKPPYRSPHYVSLIDGKKVGSFVLEYDVQQRSDTGNHRDHCVFFSFADPSHFYYAHIAKAADPNAHQIMIVDNAPRRPITKQNTRGYDWGAVDRWHHVKVVRDTDKGTIGIYVEDMDKPIMATTDKTFAQGFVGFGSFDDLGRVTNIKLWAKDASDATCDDFQRKATAPDSP